MNWLVSVLLPTLLVAGLSHADLTGTEIDESNFGTTDKSNRFTTPGGSAEMDNGMIIKWGEATVAALSTSETVTFDTAFPTDILSVEVAVEAGSLSGSSASVSSISRTDFTINLQCLSLTGPIACSSSTTVKWSARGY